MNRQAVRNFVAAFREERNILFSKLFLFMFSRVLEARILSSYQQRGTPKKGGSFFEAAAGLRTRNDFYLDDEVGPKCNSEL